LKKIPAAKAKRAVRVGRPPRLAAKVQPKYLIVATEPGSIVIAMISAPGTR
jgi:hypothetical protein